MTKRFCDGCGEEMDWNDVYYLEELRVVNRVVSGSELKSYSPSDVIIGKRDLCAKCSPKTWQQETK